MTNCITLSTKSALLYLHCLFTFKVPDFRCRPVNGISM